MSTAAGLAAPSLIRRMACWLYEGVLLFAALLLGTLAFSVSTDMRSGMAQTRPLLIAFLLMLAGIYFSWFWSKGQTLPMRTWRIRLVDRHGRPVTQQRALVRYIYCSIWFAPVIAVLQARPGYSLTEAGVLLGGWVTFWALSSRLHPQRQFWHDVWAGTRLVSVT